MLRAAALAGAVILSASCGKSESTEGLGTVASAPGSGKASGGFSADLAKELAGSKPAEPADPKAADPAKSGGAGDGRAAATGGEKSNAGDHRQRRARVERRATGSADAARCVRRCRCLGVNLDLELAVGHAAYVDELTVAEEGAVRLRTLRFAASLE